MSSSERFVLPEGDQMPHRFSEIDCFFGQLEGSDVNQMINTGKGVEVDFYTVYQETLLGTSCGKGRKIYQVLLNSWIMFFERRSRGGEAVWVS